MSRPLFSVKYVATESMLPKKLERGRAYFVADEQIIIVDMGDGRGPVRYGDKPGPQGMAGEPIPQLQDQINDLASASIQTTINIHNIRAKNKQELDDLQSAVNLALQSANDNAERISDESENSAKSIINILAIIHDKFAAYDDAINILAKAVSNLYPYEHGASAGDPVIPIATGEIITSGDTTYIVDSAVVDGDTGTVILTLYDSVSKPKITEVQEGDTVSFDGGKFTVNSVDRSGDTGIITITLYQE